MIKFLNIFSIGANWSSVYLIIAFEIQFLRLWYKDGLFFCYNHLGKAVLCFYGVLKGDYIPSNVFEGLKTFAWRWYSFILFLTRAPHSSPHLSRLKSLFSKQNLNKKPLINWWLRVCFVAKTGVEPVTSGLWILRSNQLSYLAKCSGKYCSWLRVQR